MKKIFYATLLISALIFATTQTQAQAWERNTKVLALGFGASQFFHLDGYYYNHYYNGTPRHYRAWYWPVTGQINFQGEFGIHKYVGLGFTTGFGGRGGWPHNYPGEVNIPIGMICNFHFYQLIEDKTDKDIHGDKLDIYVGASIGSGIAFIRYPNYPDYPATTRVTPLAFGGLHAGLRYYFKPKVGVNAEVGFGKSIVNVGFVFKI
jgi:hypothetical protein